MFQLYYNIIILHVVMYNIKKFNQDIIYYIKLFYITQYTYLGKSFKQISKIALYKIFYLNKIANLYNAMVM